MSHDIHVRLTDEELARIDAVAASAGLSREEMLQRLSRFGLSEWERKARDEEGPRRNLAAKVIDRLFLVAHGTEQPTDDEWRQHLSLIEQHGIDRTMMLVFTEGGWPSASQRRRLDTLLADRVPIAVISPLLGVRLRLRALSWLRGNRIRVFAGSVSGLLDALAYLEVPASRLEIIQREAGRLRAHVRGR